MGQEHTVTAATLNVTPCVYFTTEIYTTTSTQDNVSDVVLYDYTHMVLIAERLWTNKAGTGMLATLSDKGWVTQDLRNKILIQGSLTYTLRCQSNETEYVTAYYCKPRGAIVFDTQFPNVNVYNYLALGFAQMGMDSGSTIPSTQDYMRDDDFSPFDSLQFCQNFKIYKVKRIKINVSEQRTLRIKSKRHLLSPSRIWNVFDTTLNWSTAYQKYAYMPQAKFILFKFAGRNAALGADQPATTYVKAITKTTPTIAMDTIFRYKAKLVAQPYSPHSTLLSSGILATANPQIIQNQNIIETTEKDAS